MKRLLFLSILSVFMFACSSNDDENNNNDNEDGFVELSNQEILVDSSPFNEPTYNIINILQNSTPEKEYAEIDNEIVNYLYSSTYEFKADGTFIFTDGFNNEFVTTYSYNESEDEIILADLNDFFVDNFKIIEFYRDYDAENGSDYRN